MIQCPFCRTPLTESSPACPSCNLDLKRANAVMGPVPLLSSSGLTVLTRPMDPAGEKPIHRRILAFQQRFPQCRINALVCRFPENYPPPTYLFWIFNSGGFSGAEQIRGRNRDILIGIDLEQQTAGLIVGYGLEPFLSQASLDEILNSALPILRTGDLPGGIIEIIDGLDRLMVDTCRELPAMLGIEQELTVEAKSTDF